MDIKNIVYLYVPEAKIMSISADKKSMGDPITETGKSLLRKAKLNATVLLKQYIVNIGKQVGKF